MSLHFMFFLSGMSSLLYQVLWVREFGNIFGNSVYSASLVVSIFMLGLGVGSLLAGKFVDRYRFQALKFYAWTEVLIALLGLSICFILPSLGSVSANFSSYVQSLQWYELSYFSYFIRYATAIFLLGPITILMGATLTLLIRHVLAHNTHQASLRIGLLYGFNTAGAALACFSVDFYFIPSFGLSFTYFIAVGANLVAAVIAFLLPGIKSQSPVLKKAWSGGQFLLCSVFFSGLGAMGIEILWFRFFNNYLNGNRALFSILLLGILLGTWLGSLCSGLINRNFKNTSGLLMVSQTLLVLSTLGGLYFFSNTANGWVLKMSFWALRLPMDFQIRDFAIVFSMVIFVVGLPAFFMGFVYPLANGLVQDSKDTVANKAGTIYFWNTLGGMSGALMAGFLLLPLVGIQTSVLILMSVTLASILPLYFHAKSRMAFVCIGLGVVSLVGWHSLRPHFLIQKSLNKTASWVLDRKLLKLSEGVNETILISQQKKDKSIELFTNGHLMSTTSYSAQRYMRSFSHIPLLHLDNPETALVICFGVGSTTHAASLHTTIKTLEVADLSKNILNHANFFHKNNHGVLSNPKVKVYVNDGKQHIRMQPNNKYDLITLEPPPISFAGVNALYSQQFYEQAYRTLNKGGFISQWIPIYQTRGPKIFSMIKAMLNVFDDVVLLSGTHGDMILMGRKLEQIKISPTKIDNYLAKNPAVKKDLKRILIDQNIDVLGMFVASAKHLKELTKNAWPVSDNHPLLEYGMLLTFETKLPANLSHVEDITEWCPSCLNWPELNAYLGLTKALYRSEGFNTVNRNGARNAKLTLKEILASSPIFSEQDKAFNWIDYNETRANHRYLSVLFDPLQIKKQRKK